MDYICIVYTSANFHLTVVISIGIPAFVNCTRGRKISTSTFRNFNLFAQIRSVYKHNATCFKKEMN